MWHIGVDAHKTRCSLTAKDDAGKLVARRVFPHTREGWTSALKDAPKGSRVAVECVGWHQPILEHIEAMNLVPVLVHAKNVSLIATSKKKNDKYDSEVLCDLLRTGFLPTSHFPSKKTRELRELTRYHDALVKKLIHAKNTVHRVLEKAWVALPEISDIFGIKGREWLSKVNVSPAQQVVLEAALFEYDNLVKIRKNLEHEIAKMVEHDEETNLLLTIDGLGPMSAATLRAEIDTAERFSNRKKIRSNFGLATSVRDSADTQRRGRITKQGPGVVRKVLVQGAPHFARTNPAAKKKQDRLSKQRGRNIARVATAGDMLDMSYQVLKTRTPYRHARPDLLANKRRDLARLAGRPQPLSVS